MTQEIMTVQQLLATGTLSWNLGAETEISAGEVLRVSGTVSNPTSARRTYSLLGGLYDKSSNMPISGSAFELVSDGQKEFSLSAGGRKSFDFSYEVPVSDVLFLLSLWDAEEVNIVAQLLTELATPTPVGVTDIVSSIIPVFTIGLLFGILTPMIKGFSRRK